MSLAVIWHPPVEEDLRRLPWQDAASVVGGVNALAEDGVGDVRVEALPSGRRVFLLMLARVREIAEARDAVSDGIVVARALLHLGTVEERMAGENAFSGRSSATISLTESNAASSPTKV